MEIDKNCLLFGSRLARCCVLLATLSVGCGSDYHEPVWSQRFDSLSESCGTDVAVDGEGSIVVVGTYQDSLSVGGDELPRANGGALFVAKYNSDGEAVWSRQLTTEDATPHLTIDSEGSILVAVHFAGSVTLEGATLTSAGDSDILVIKLSPQGVVLWAKRVGGAANEVILDMATTGSDIVLAGSFFGQSTFGGEFLAFAGGTDGYVARLDSEGEHLWSTSYGGSGTDWAHSLAVSPNGQVGVAGTFEGNIETAEFDGSHVVNQYSANGVLADSWAVAGPAHLVAWDATGNDLFLAGAVEYPLTLGEGNGEVSGEFLARVAPGGNLVWKTKADDRRWRDMAVDVQERVHLVSDSRVGSGDGRIVWLTSFNADGDKLGRREVYDSLGGARVTAVASGADGDVVVTGCAYDDKVFGNDESFFLTKVLAP